MTMGTKDNPGAFDCYEKAEPDEPFFMLLARDKHAPTLVWLWATLRELDGEDKAVVAEARSVVGDMIGWAYLHGRKSTGLGQSTLAGVCELIRTANAAQTKVPQNAPTELDAIRQFLGVTQFEMPPGPSDREGDA